jgi:ABC-type sulfate transport system permease component
MTARGVFLFLWLLLMACLQLALVALPAGLILADRPQPDWPQLWTLLQQSRAPLAALVAMLAALGPGTLAALALWRRRRLGLRGGLLLTPVLMPVALLAGGDTLLRLAGHAGLGLALGAICGFIGLSTVDPALLRAAASCGLSPPRAWRAVLLPLAGPGVLAGLVLANVASLALSLVAAAPPLPLEALLRHPAAMTAALGVSLLLCAATAAALALLRRP